MLKRLINLPFSVATRAARAFQEREDAKMKEKYGTVADPGDVAISDAPAIAPDSTPVDATAFRMDAAAAIEAGNGRRPVAFVDVRKANERGSGTIAGAIHMPHNEIGIRVSELPPDQLVVAYCEDGTDSAKAVAFFRERGMEDTYWLGGGLRAWRTAGGRVQGGA
jgi:rhodanese-related sulfurtransferase